MKIFAGSANKPLAEKIAKNLGLSLSPIEHHVFPDGEQRIMVNDEVLGQHCVVVQPTSPPVDQHYMELFLIIDALKRSGASSVSVVVPYMGYMRQDHVFRSGEARSLEVVARTMEECGGDMFFAVDVHSIKIPSIFMKPFVHVSALPLFAEKIQELGWGKEDTVLVSPDMGGINRISKLSELCGEMSYAAVEKNRDLVSGNVAADVIHGDTKRRAIIVDDMIASGGTIKTACDLLATKGVEEMVVMATHAVFAKEAPEILESSKASKIYVTDTIEVSESKMFSKLEILSLSQALSDRIKEIGED
jgi:ribose-phosphate pyrophosphokinase